MLTPDPNGKGLLVDLHGDLAGILNIATKRDRVKHAQEFDLKRIRMVVGMDFAAAANLQGKVVGPEGNHLARLFQAIGLKPQKLPTPSP